MKKYLFLVFTICYLFSFGQSDTSKIYNSTHLKRGFYRTYKEFESNSPSRTEDFIVTRFIKSETDTTVIGAKYTLVDSTKEVHHVWGFCDGKDVYVNLSESPFSKHYWKLLGLGPIPFFEYKVKKMLLAGGPLMMLATGALSASMPAEYELLRLNKNGKFRDIGVVELRDLLADYPILLKEFNAKTYVKTPVGIDPRRAPQVTAAEFQKQYDAVIEYLAKLNEVLRKKG